MSPEDPHGTAALGRTLGEYLSELRGKRAGKPTELREALDLYIQLWSDAAENGVVGMEDDLSLALGKIEKAGGLHKASEARPPETSPESLRRQ